MYAILGLLLLLRRKYLADNFIVHMLSLIGASLREPHSNVESGVVVHAQRIVMKNGIAIHYCSFGTVVHVQTNTINSIAKIIGIVY